MSGSQHYETCRTPKGEISYHMQTNVSIERDVIGGISVHNIHKVDVLFFSSVYI